jgi:hypothetical protein
MAGDIATSVYYSSSTMAQVLAGGTGILGAVSVFSVGRLDEAVELYGTLIVSTWPAVSADDPNHEAFLAHDTWQREGS